MEASVERYRGLDIVFRDTPNGVVAGFPKNPRLVIGRDKREAFELMKNRIAKLSPVVVTAYKRHGRIMRKLEQMGV